MSEFNNGEINIGAKLRELRLAKGIKKIEVLVGRANQGVTNEDDMLTTYYVYKLESGTVKSPGLEILSRYAKGLNMTVGELTDYITGAKKVTAVTPIRTISELANTLLLIDERYGAVEIPVIGHIPTRDELDIDKSIGSVYIHKALVSDGGIDAMRSVIADDDALSSEGVHRNYHLIYHPLDQGLIDGEKYLIRIHGETYAAVLSRFDENTLNVQRYDQVVQVPESDVKILGRVYHWGHWHSSKYLKPDKT